LIVLRFVIGVKLGITDRADSELGVALFGFSAGLSLVGLVPGFSTRDEWITFC
jgi:hypothetical protein